ncbi:hypothetical protein H4Q26_012693 [Puccinia striiformis f. sp. tritici PST-130]|nr:hypothetical protein H4Q26_012693 [Puccinia striiformis f. sp. tritici PST-130]
MDTNILEKTAGDTLPPAPDKSATTDEHLNRFLQIQNAGAIQMQEAIRAVLNLQRIDREAAAEERRESGDVLRSWRNRCFAPPSIAAVDESPVPDTLAEEFESFPPPAFENAELSVISEQTIDTVDAVQLHEEDHLAPEYCTGDLTQTVDWRD